MRTLESWAPNDGSPGALERLVKVELLVLPAMDIGVEGAEALGETGRAAVHRVLLQHDDLRAHLRRLGRGAHASGARTDHDDIAAFGAFRIMGGRLGYLTCL